METFVILHNVRSAHNVGSIFRTADGAGVSKIYLTGYTPAPTDRFGREQPQIKKTSLGAAQSIPWEAADSIGVCIKQLRDREVAIVAVEQCAQALDYRRYEPEGKTAYIFGNETEGISEDIIARADIAVSIPMLGTKESLNVSVAAGIILFRGAQHGSF